MTYITVYDLSFNSSCKATIKRLQLLLIVAARLNYRFTQLWQHRAKPVRQSGDFKMTCSTCEYYSILIIFLG